MDSQPLRYFVEVARHQHFTRAAEALGVAQPAVSQRIRVLERQLGIQLFERTSRSVRLTVAGRTLLEGAAPLLDQLDQLGARMQELATAGLAEVTLATIRWIPGIDLSAILKDFHDTNPTVRVNVRERTSAAMLDMVSEREIDLAILQRPRRIRRDIVATDLATDQFVLIVPPTHRLADRQRVRMEELTDEHFVTLEEGSGVRRSLIEAAHRAGFEPELAAQTLQLDTVRDVVAAGIGVALVPRSGLREEDTNVRIIDVGSPRIVRRIIVVNRRGSLTPAAAALRQTICDAFAREQTHARG